MKTTETILIKTQTKKAENQLKDICGEWKAYYSYNDYYWKTKNRTGNNLWQNFVVIVVLN